MRSLFTISMFIVILFGCRKPFEPPAGAFDPSVLVVEGTIAVGDQAENLFQLSRIRALQDTAFNDPEPGASVRILAASGGSWPLTEVSPGAYAATLNLPVSDSYQLAVQTADGNSYLSDLQQPVLTPPIDSVTWAQPGDLNIFVHTHDPANATRYYRWQYVETWQNSSWYESTLDFVNGAIVSRPIGEQVHNCWSSDSSQSILINNSSNLSNDIISYQPVNTILRPSFKLALRYSILVKQIGLTREAYDFWTILKKNTELTGTLFDPQPSKMPTNIHCTNDPGKVAIGFISAATITEKRIFIMNSAMSDWPIPDQSENCPQLLKSIPDAITYMLNDPFYVPVAYPTIGPGIYIASKYCVDCRLSGGTNIPPSFW